MGELVWSHVETIHRNGQCEIIDNAYMSNIMSQIGSFKWDILTEPCCVSDSHDIVSEVKK